MTNNTLAAVAPAGNGVVAAAAEDDVQFFARANKYLVNTGVPYSPLVVTRAQGTALYDSRGRRILDFTSGQMSSLLGHSHPEVVEVVRRYAGELDHLLSNMLTHPVVDLAERLARLLPAPLEQSFFLSTGSETTEAAIKMAKLYTGKFEVVAFSASYHGLTQGAASATYSAGRKNGGPAMPGQLAFPAPYAYRSVFRTKRSSSSSSSPSDGSKDEDAYDWQAEMDYGWAMIDRQSVGSLAAFILEPILSTGGVLGYLARLRDECHQRGMLLILDEAQTGVGRTGTMWAFEQHRDRDGHAVVPDILALSKTLALAAERGAQLRAGLLRLQKKHWCIGDVRGRGLLQGIEIIADAATKAPGPALGQAVSDRAMARGLSCNIVNLPGMGGVFRIAPPVTVTPEEIEEGVRILDEAFEYALATWGKGANGVKKQV
ncbi:aminotransferase class-III [Niveomyces insectorum RCEF 264]|uniref:Aminotransferase class-III n=1 Tax=Niveomyces insectorum RCEF 264 TaxID=1081102 RepID=A0A167S405_9HYPO|nr:aminotransferase class-III [Niveomyces insectorum RCEF 264]